MNGLPARLGQFRSEHVSSLALIGGGTAALIGSRYLPSPWKTAGVVGGIGLIGLGLLKTVEAAQEAEALAPGPKGLPVERDFEAVGGRILRPSAYSVVEYTFWGGRYPVTVALENAASRPVSVHFALSAVETAFNALGDQTSRQNGIVWDVYITLPPGGQEVIPIEVELLHGLGLPFYTHTFSVELELTKSRLGPAREARTVVLDGKTFFAK